ncbi:MAG: hypothetical protein QOG68_109 [Solirubrobacteraceae bacterium]|nr:hypothetical protein [Solirubrobacteraceae bacterium]
MHDEITIVVRPHTAGFFSNFNKVVNHLHKGLGNDGVVAVKVDWQVREPIPHFVYGLPADGNVWDHLFEPLAFPHFPPATRDGQKWSSVEMTGIHAYDYYRRPDWREELHRTYARHIRVRPDLRARLDALLPTDPSIFRVGVHYRHPTHSAETPFPIRPLGAFVRRARRLVGLRRRWQVVLATDVDDAVDHFRAAFGSRLVVQPGVDRSSGAEQMHHVGNVRGVALAQQVLLDALMLARCDALVHVTSNVATAVGYMNPRLRMVYCEPFWETWRARAGQGRPRALP